MPIVPRRLLQGFLAILSRLLRHRRYRIDLGRGRAAGSAAYRLADAPCRDDWCFEVHVSSGSQAELETWARHQTLERLRLHLRGEIAWESDGLDAGSSPLLFSAPGASLPEVGPAFAETATLVLAAEGVSALVLGLGRGGGARSPDLPEITELGQLNDPRIRPCAVFKTDSWRYDPARDLVEPREDRPDGGLRVKVIGARGVVEPSAAGAPRSARRRGSYLADHDLGARAELQVHDASRWRRQTVTDRPGVPRMLVLAPFLARGGAEHTLFETLAALRDRWHIAFATLAPHRPELGDRRADFQALWPHLYCLGDLVHPAAMPGMLASILEAWQPQVIYNANSTTLFYDFLPGLRRQLPEARILDHLYDHRVGYIERYRDPALEGLVDVVVAENRPIARTLAQDHGWPAARVPVVWPCGRPPSAFPAPEQARETRQRLRAELGLADDDVVVLTAARMHAQKRPLDLVRLAGRLRDVPELRFLVVGGGELEAEVDDAIAASSGAPIRRLPFRTDIPHLITACDVGCLVSEFEGLPVFLLECLQAGVPFLGTDVGDLGHVIRSTGAGWVVDRPGDLDALEAAVRHLMAGDERNARAAAAAAASTAFGVEACAERYHAVFRGAPRDAEL